MAGIPNIEYKESWQDEYLEWICGFANTQGGIIYIESACCEISKADFP